MKKKNITVGVIISILVFVIYAAAGYLLWLYSDSASYDFLLQHRGFEVSPDNKYAVMLNSTASPKDDPSFDDLKSLIGSSYTEQLKVTVEERETDKQLAVIETSTQMDVSKSSEHDDGVSTKCNYNVIWEDNSVKIILKDEHHQDKTYVIPLQ